MAAPIPEGFFKAPIDMPFTDMVGPIYYRPSEENLHVGFAADERHLNPGGVIHGGMLMTVADDLMGATVYRVVGAQPMATVSLNCDFLSAVRPGDWVHGIGDITRRTRSMVFVRSVLSVEDRPVLSAAGIMKLIERE